MKRFSGYAKAGAILSSLILVGGFIAYRAGLFTASMSSSKSTFMFVGSKVRSEQQSPPTDPTALPGSKSLVLTKPGTPQPTPTPAQPDKPQE